MIKTIHRALGGIHGNFLSALKFRTTGLILYPTGLAAFTFFAAMMFPHDAFSADTFLRTTTMIINGNGGGTAGGYNFGGKAADGGVAALGRLTAKTIFRVNPGRWGRLLNLYYLLAVRILVSNIHRRMLAIW